MVTGYIVFAAGGNEVGDGLARRLFFPCDEKNPEGMAGSLESIRKNLVCLCIIRVGVDAEGKQELKIIECEKP